MLVVLFIPLKFNKKIDLVPQIFITSCYQSTTCTDSFPLKQSNFSFFTFNFVLTITMTVRTIQQMLRTRRTLQSPQPHQTNSTTLHANEFQLITIKPSAQAPLKLTTSNMFFGNFNSKPCPPAHLSANDQANTESKLQYMGSPRSAHSQCTHGCTLFFVHNFVPI